MTGRRTVADVLCQTQGVASEAPHQPAVSDTGGACSRGELGQFSAIAVRKRVSGDPGYRLSSASELSLGFSA